MKIIEIKQKESEYKEPIYDVTTSHFFGLKIKTTSYKELVGKEYTHLKGRTVLIDREGEVLECSSPIVEAVTNFKRKW